MGRDVCWKLEVDLGGGSGLGRARARVRAGECEGSDARARVHVLPAPPLGYVALRSHNHPSNIPSLDTRRYRYKRCVDTGMVAERAKGVEVVGRVCNVDGIGEFGNYFYQIFFGFLYLGGACAASVYYTRCKSGWTGTVEILVDRNSWTIVIFAV